MGLVVLHGIFVEYFPRSFWKWEIFYGVLLVSQNIVMDLSNVILGDLYFEQKPLWHLLLKYTNMPKYTRIKISLGCWIYPLWFMSLLAYWTPCYSIWRFISLHLQKIHKFCISLHTYIVDGVNQLASRNLSNMFNIV